MDATGRFTDVLQRVESDIALDEACFLIAAHARPDVDVDVRCRQLDALASSLDARDPGALAHTLFAELGFAGNSVDYGDPNNSYLDAVLDRRLGIPITLSVLMMEVGRRLDIAVHGVGMPGHFLVGAGPSEWYDPFNRGIRLDDAGCAERFSEIQRGTPFHRDYLAPVGPLAILDRMLANLQHSLIERDPARAAWPTRLRLRIPGISPAQRAELAALLGSLGRFSEAAIELDTVAREMPGPGSEQAAQAAARFRARAN
jgi:regulator of sirC expression with transglutaminase-like and TPR domain